MANVMPEHAAAVENSKRIIAQRDEAVAALTCETFALDAEGQLANPGAARDRLRKALSALRAALYTLERTG